MSTKLKFVASNLIVAPWIKLRVFFYKWVLRYHSERLMEFHARLVGEELKRIGLAEGFVALARQTNAVKSGTKPAGTYLIPEIGGYFFIYEDGSFRPTAEYSPPKGEPPS